MSTIKRNIKVFGRGFIEGFSSLFDLYPDKTKVETRGLFDDYKAIKGDWEKVGSDLQKAINQFEEQHQHKNRV